MRVLLDECVNQRLRHFLPGHDCESAKYAGFGGLKNGELLDAAESDGFDVLLTVDRGLEYEHNLNGRKISIIIFRTNSIALKDLLPHGRNAWRFCCRLSAARSRESRIAVFSDQRFRTGTSKRFVCAQGRWRPAQSF